MLENSVNPLVEAEYSALRSEIRQWADRQGKIEDLTLVAAGALFAASSQLPLATFAYPVLAMFLAARWVTLGLTIGQIAVYLKNKYEDNYKDTHGLPNWETYLKDPRSQEQFRVGSILSLVLGPLAAVGLFVGTQAAAIWWSWAMVGTKQVPTQFKSPLIVVDILAAFITLIFLAAAAKVYGARALSSRRELQ